MEGTVKLHKEMKDLAGKLGEPNRKPRPKNFSKRKQWQNHDSAHEGAGTDRQKDGEKKETRPAVTAKSPRIASSRQRGFAGKTFAWWYVLETNMRKAMHLHASLYGGASPALLAAVAGHESVERLVCAALDSMFVAEAPLNYHVLSVAREVLQTKVVRHSYLPDMEYDGEGGRFKRTATFSAMFSSNHMHRHQNTCHKGKSGKCGCRMARPAGHPVPWTRVVELRPRLSSCIPCAGNATAASPPADEVEWRCPYCGGTAGGADDVVQLLTCVPTEHPHADKEKKEAQIPLWSGVCRVQPICTCTCDPTDAHVFQDVSLYCGAQAPRWHRPITARARRP